MPQIKNDPPPQTEILSEGTRREVNDPQTSLNAGFADPSGTAAPTAPEQTVQEQQPQTGVPEGTPQPETEPQFTIDEEQTPTEPPEGDRVKDAQRAFHETRQENAELRKILSAMVAKQHLGGQPSTPAISPEAINFEPTEDERLDPTRYARRLVEGMEVKRQQESSMLEMQNFVDTHPDWQDVYSTMEEIRMQEPWIAGRPGTLNRLYKRAKEQEELRGYREAIKKSADTAMQAGIQMQKQKGGKPFVSPSGGGTMRSKSNVPPADFVEWDYNRRVQWLKEHGLWKDES